MAIKTITKVQFDAFSPARTPMATAIATEKAWFTDDAGNIVGTVMFDQSDKDWNYVILGRDERGALRWIEGDSSFSSQDEAEQRLTAAMSKIEESGKTVFPQGD